MPELAVLPGDVTRGRRKPLHETLPERLKRAREGAGLESRPLSLQAGLADSTVWTIETEGRIPRIDTAERIARALGVSPCYLAYGVEGAALAPDDELRSAGCGERLRQLRERCGLSLRALAGAAKTSDTTVRLTETGETIPSVATAEALAVALGCSPCWLAYAEGPSPLDDPDGAAAELQAVKYRPPRSPRKAGD
jgi:transcriptional regulator with XRE-family HTH domain